MCNTNNMNNAVTPTQILSLAKNSRLNDQDSTAFQMLRHGGAEIMAAGYVTGKLDVDAIRKLGAAHDWDKATERAIRGFWWDVIDGDF
jgi:hypothetical protein